MRAATQLVIDQMYGGDKEIALRHAQHEVNTNSRPPQWALDLAGPRAGWKTPAGMHCH